MAKLNFGGVEENVVTREEFPRAVTFNSGAFQLSSVLGPVAFGALIALTPHAEIRATAWSVYALNILASLACFPLGEREHAEAVAHLDELLSLAAHPNIAVKATGVPSMAKSGFCALSREKL